MRKAYQEQIDKAKAEGISNCPYCAIGHYANSLHICKLDEMEAGHVTSGARATTWILQTARCSARQITGRKDIYTKH